MSGKSVENKEVPRRISMHFSGRRRLSGSVYSEVDCGANLTLKQWRTQNFFSGGGGVQQIQLWTEGTENRDRGRSPHSQGFRPICKWVKPVFLLGS
jgi:hypothetical protein